MFSSSSLSCDKRSARSEPFALPVGDTTTSESAHELPFLVSTAEHIKLAAVWL